MKHCIFLFFTMLFFARLASGIEVSGEVSGVWTPDDSPYIVTGNIQVNEGDSLFVMPGTEVRFDGEFSISVLGWLRITGTEEDSVIITSNSNEPEPRDWRGIHVSTEAPVPPFISYSKIEYAFYGLEIPFGEVCYSTFQNCIGGLFVSFTGREEGDSIYVHHNVFLDNESCGILTNAFQNSRGTIAYNLFIGNDFGFLMQSGTFYILNNTFANNIRIGIAAPFPEGWAFIFNNIFTGSEGDVAFGLGGDNNNSFDNDRIRVVGELVSVNANGIPCDESGNFSINPGFVGGDPFLHELQPNSPCIDTGYPELPPDDDGTRRDLGAFPSSQEDEFEIVLEESWSIISLPLWTPVRRIELQIEPFIDIENLLLLKDEDGRFWVPTFNFSNLDPFDHHKGYLIKMDASEAILDTGTFIPADEPIPLDERWQIIAYYPETDLEAPDAFASIVDNLLIAKDDEGRFYLPEHNFNNMAPLRRGKGYMVKMGLEDLLIYPEDNGE